MQTSPKSLNDKVEATVRFAAALDSNLIVLHPAPEWPSHDQIETLARGFAKYKLAIENTNSVAVEWVKILSEYIECGIALDISHARYLGQPIDYYFTANVFHTHIRGYNSCERYTRIGPSDHEAIFELLYKEKQGLYKGALMLEYPYISLDDACDDKDVLTQLRKLVFE